MVNYIALQRDFTHGELSPLLSTRTDKEFYYKSAKRLRNVVVLPQGAVTRRFGTEYKGEFVAPLGKYKGHTFNLSETKSYLIIFVPHEMYIFDDNALAIRIATPYTEEEVESIDTTQTKNNLLIMHKNHPIKYLYKEENTEIFNGWHFSDVQFRYLPTWDFDSNYFTSTFILGGVVPWQYNSLTCSTPVFTANHVGGLFIGFGDFAVNNKLGVARITEFISSTHVKVIILNKFAQGFLTAISGRECSLQEVAWSAQRGYPTTGTFFAGRFITAGSKSLPQTIFMSVINDYYNFNEGTGEADDAVVATIATDEISTIQHVVGVENLQMFTISSEYCTKDLATTFSLGDFLIRKQPTGIGAENIKPVLFDNSTVFVKKGGKAIIAFSFVDSNAAYIANNISVLSEHLINKPRAIGRKIRSANNDSDLLFIVNGDGSLAILNSSVEEKILAWSLATTNGKFKDVIEVGSEVYFLVERTVGVTKRNLIEKLNYNSMLDSTIKYTSSLPVRTINGLEHLENQTVRIIGDGYILNSKKVLNGSVTIDDTENEIKTVEVGLDIATEIETMPITPPPSPIDYSFMKKKLLNIFLEVQNSAGLYVNGIYVEDRMLNQTLPYPPIQPFTGTKKIEYNQGDWEERPTISITQKDPLPMTIIGIGYEIKV